MSQPKVELADPIVVGIALGKAPEKLKESSSYRIVSPQRATPKPAPASGRVVLGVALPASSKVRALG